MKKNKLYRYNPETDNFERFYPTIKDRLLTALRYLIAGLVLGGIIYWLVFIFIGGPTEKNLRSENKELKKQLKSLNQRINKSLSVLEDIQTRDDNFYRVMMQMEPMSYSQRFTSFMPKNHDELKQLSDAQLVSQLTSQIDQIEKQIMAQSISFDQLKKAAFEQQNKINHIPSVLPIHIEDYTMSSGYGWRSDPIYGTSKFHQGLDFAASMGTKVYATADGKVVSAENRGEYGNCVEVEHGYDYTTRYAHLSKILVNSGQEIKRGDLIGLVGSTGKSTGPHLHYEVRLKDEAQNPINYYFMDITPAQYNEMIQMSANAGHVMD